MTAQELYDLPFFDLIYKAHGIHREHFKAADIQKCELLSIKTGGCPEDCAYCPQSAHYKTNLPATPLLDLKIVEEKIQDAKHKGAERFCLGAAWRDVKDGPQFDQVLDMVRAIKAEGMEACVTLGMLTLEQAQKLKEAGLDAYNHNLDTSRDYYPQIISTRTYDDRLTTLKYVREAGIQVCSGGILGMGESIQDRCDLIDELASMKPQPESVPINLLIPVEGTPLADAKEVPLQELVRLIAVARILMPKSRVRLSAGRQSLSEEAHWLCFFAGANSIFLGEKLLTRPNRALVSDQALLQSLS